jgi:hypothetical protein
MMQLTNEAKHEIKTMSTEKLKNFRKLVAELAEHKDEKTSEYFTLMGIAIDSEILNRLPVYTIQNECGDRGFIQIIQEGKEIDEVQGYKTTFNPEYKDCYVIIDKTDYDMILKCHERYAETTHDHYLEMIDYMTTYLLSGDTKTIE